MNKMIIMTFITAISLFFTVLAYFGYLRLVKLRMLSCEKYAKVYANIPRADIKNKLIVSLFTRHQNLNNIKACINSLLDQTMRPDQIIVNIPENHHFEMPACIKDNNILILHKLSPKYGECLSFISPLIREKNADTVIIAVNDKSIYGPDFIETMVEESNKAPNNLIYISGYNAHEFISTGKKIDMHSDNDIVRIDYGVLFKPSMFDDDILDVEKGPAHVNDCPDIFLSYHMNKKMLSKTQIEYGEVFPHSIDNKYEKICIEYYSAYFPSIK